MIEYNENTKQTHVFCDRCQVELTDNVYVLSSGDCLCKPCFDNSYEVEPVEEYINANT